MRYYDIAEDEMRDVTWRQGQLSCDVWRFRLYLAWKRESKWALKIRIGKVKGNAREHRALFAFSCFGMAINKCIIYRKPYKLVDDTDYTPVKDPENKYGYADMECTGDYVAPDGKTKKVRMVFRK
jgi:hypothetical protein